MWKIGTSPPQPRSPYCLIVFDSILIFAGFNSLGLMVALAIWLPKSMSVYVFFYLI